MPDALTYYLNKIQKLRIDRSHGKPALHKPILLLTVLDLIEQGEIVENKITPSPQLVDVFLKYSSRIGLMALRPFFPFYHLKTSGFWHLHAKQGQEAVFAAVTQFKSMPQLARVIAFASLDEDLFILFLNPETREVIRQAIIKTYFSNQSEIIQAVVNENRQVSDIEEILLQQAQHKTGLAQKEVPETPLRSAAFRGVIMKLYNYTCAACQLRIITLSGASAVDAAHIVPFSESHDDGIGNGLALCKLHHWAFDTGILSVDDRYQIIVSSAFEENGSKEMLIKSLGGRKIILPEQKPFFPSLHAVRWHRSNKFQN
jgi:putative restriction endonuclease